MDGGVIRISAGSNCFLIRTPGRFVLVDSGVSSRRQAVAAKLTGAGCRPGDLELIVLTHGDSDHAGNAAYLREAYGAKIGMHAADQAMVESGDMSEGRKPQADRVKGMGRVISLVGELMSLFGPPQFDRFSPDLTLEDGQTLSPYGLDATVVHLPGHSKGSIGLLTSEGDLFCGDLIYNFFGPEMIWIDDLPAALASVEQLKRLNVRTVYPGHGKPFPWAEFAAKH
jgi:hydroxyacylglutathione hydrolase